jgi:hypothetical protein
MYRAASADLKDGYFVLLLLASSSTLAPRVLLWATSLVFLSWLSSGEGLLKQSVGPQV